MRALRWLIAGVVAACAGCELDQAPALPWAEEPLPPVPVPADNPMTQEKVELGRLLFHDPLLSSDRQVACVTCHGQIWGLSDGLPVSVGVGGVGPAGTGRTGPNLTRRNASTLWNAAYRDSLMWDGRFDSLEDQVLGPLEDDIELGRAPVAVVADLRGIDEYVELFERAFPEEIEPVSVRTMQKAIAAFERTLISDDAPYDRYVAGDVGALSAQAVAGMFLFAEVGCAGCHAPPLFESERFADVGVAASDDDADLGRYEVTGDPADLRVFRVPTLRNLRETGPYFHDGSARTIEEAVPHAIARPLRAGEIEAIATFLRKGLTDRSREPDRPRTVPSGLEVPIDGYGIPR